MIYPDSINIPTANSMFFTQNTDISLKKKKRFRNRLRLIWGSNRIRIKAFGELKIQNEQKITFLEI